MVVLIVKKTTNYELHGPVIEAKVKVGHVPADALVKLRAAHTEHYQTLESLRKELAKAKIDFDEVSRDDPWPTHRKHDLVVTVGGDGTLLAATHQMKEGGLTFGLRSSFSSVGFLCCAGPADVQALVKAIVRRQFETAEVQRLKAVVTRIDSGETLETKPVLNDFLYTNTNPAATTRYKLHFANRSETHRSSGIWVATATGSTAAIMAAGGERRPLTESSFQFRVRELYRLDLTTAQIDQGFFEPEKATLEIDNRCPAALLALDGQHGMIELSYGDRVTFKRAKPLTLVRGFVGGERTGA